VGGGKGKFRMHQRNEKESSQVNKPDHLVLYFQEKPFSGGEVGVRSRGRKLWEPEADP